MRKIFKKKKIESSSYYLPGEEINVCRKDMFSQWNINDSKSFECSGKKRILFGISLCSLAYLIVAFRLFGICILPNIYNSPKSKIEKNETTITKNRANIVDVNGNIIATTIPTFDLNANAKFIFSPRETAVSLAKILHKDNSDAIYEKLSSGSGNYTIASDITPHQQAKIIELGEPGLEFIATSKRVYPHKHLFSHVIGFLNRDGIPQAGIEKSMNEAITESDVPLRLSVNIGVQDTIRDILYSKMKKFKADSAVAILMDANNGEIVSLVSLPDFDPNDIKTKDIPSFTITMP